MVSITQARYRAAYESNIEAAAQQDAKALDAMADAAERGAAAGRELAQATRETDEQVRRAGPTLESINRKYDENARLTGQITRANRQYASELAVLRKRQEEGTLTAERAEELARRAAGYRDNQIARAERQAAAMRNQYTAASEATTAMAAANDHASGRLGKFSQVAGQAGFQMQDMATQIAGGTNAFVALGQQLPQFLGAFGTGGAIAGAVVAVAALAANFATSAGKAALASGETSILSDVMKTLSSSIKEQQEEIEKLGLAYDKATGSRRDLLRVELQQRLVDEAKAIKAQETALNDIIERVGRGIDISVAGSGNYASEMQAFKDLQRLARAGDYGPLIEQLQRAGGVAGQLSAEALTASRAILNLRDSSRQAKEFLNNLTGGMLNLNSAAAEVTVSVESLGDQLLAAAGAQLAQAMQNYDAIMQRGRQVADSVRTNWEQWGDTQRELNELLSVGAINAETFARAMDKANPVVKMQADLLEQVRASNDNVMATITKEFDIQVQADFKAALAKGDPTGGLRAVGNEVTAVAQRAGDALGNLFLRRGWDSFVDGLSATDEALNALEADSLSASDFFGQLGDSMKNSTQAGMAFGAALASLFTDMTGGSKKYADLGSKVGGLGGKYLNKIPGLEWMPKGVGSLIGSTLGGALGGVLGGMDKADIRAIKLAADVMKYTQSLNDFVAASAPLSAIGSELSALDTKFGSLMAEAKRLKQPVEDLTRAYEVQRRAIGERVANDNLDRLYRATGQEWRAELRALTAAHATSIQDALLAEASLSGARAANAAELSAFFERFTAAQLVAMGDLVTQLDMVKARIRDLTGTLTDQIDKQIDTARQLASAARQAAAAWRELAQAARDQILSNATGELSPLSPMQQFQTLSAEFQRLFIAGSGGDVAAGRSAIGMSEELLRAGKALYASGPDYAALYAQVQGQLQQLALNGDIRATAMDQIAALADVQVTLLTDIRDILNSDLGQPTAQAIAAAIADGVLTVGEIQGINGALTELGNRFAGITGPAADAVRQAIVGLQPLLTAGALTPAQRDALTTGQTAIATALSTFRATQLEEYRQALIAAGTALSAMQTFVLDPQGRIPAAITAAFAAGGNVEQTLAASVQAMFSAALGPAFAGAGLSVRAEGVVAQAVGGAFTGAPLTVRADAVLSQAVGGDFTLPALTVRADQTFAQALGEWSGDVLSTRISSQFGTAIADWGSSADPRPLSVRVNELFGQAIGVAGSDWEGALKGLLDQQSPIVSGLSALAAQIPLLIQALTQQDGGASQAARDAALQAYVTPVQRAINEASQEVLTTPVDERSGSHNNRTIMAVDIATGAGTRIGGNKDSDASRARATQLGGGLAGIARQIEMLTGGTLSGLSVQAGEENSGYSIGSVDRIGSYAGNDYTGILRGFIRDAIAQVGGVDQAIRDILAGIDFTNVTSGFSQAAQAIWNYRNPVQAAPTAQAAVATARPANDNLLSRYNEGAYLASNPDVAAAVAAGWFGSGLEHFQRYGLSEAMAGQRIPGFAAGGYHMGGLRIVGERGPELEATGPARYFPADQTARMLRPDAKVDTKALEAKVDMLTRQVERLTQAMIAGQEGVRVAVKDQVAAVQEQTAAMRRKAG